MSLTDAPLFTDIGPGPDTGAAYWAETPDGVKIRLGVWTVENARGTVLLFPGRTEYIEKYGPAAADLAQRGLATIAIDWRGQGLADRLIDDVRIGHVEHFTDYQKDVAAMMRAARSLGLPRPFFLLAHSMGGCIGLRAAMEGLPVQAAAFSGPMWGIEIPPLLRPVAQILSWVMPAIGKGHQTPPTTSPDPYVLTEPFENNTLTTDREMFQMMRDQLSAHPDLSLGGPSIIWVREAKAEMNHLASRAAPNLPCVTYLGTNERIVSPSRIVTRMEDWKRGRLEMIEGGEHEVLMDNPDVRKRIYDDMTELFLGKPSS